MSTPTQPVEVVDVVPLATPDPLKTTENWAALAATVVPALIVLFKLNLDEDTQAVLVAALGAVYAAFTLWHGKGVRAARAIATAARESGITIAPKP